MVISNYIFQNESTFSVCLSMSNKLLTDDQVTVEIVICSVRDIPLTTGTTLTCPH